MCRWQTYTYIPCTTKDTEDQLGVTATTSRGNKDKDNDGDQGGDIPAWMFRGPGMILKELWTKEVNIPEVKSSYEYVIELRECLENLPSLDD